MMQLTQNSDQNIVDARQSADSTTSSMQESAGNEINVDRGTTTENPTRESVTEIEVRQAPLSNEAMLAQIAKMFDDIQKRVEQKFTE